MQVDRTMKREIMEMVSNTYAEDPMASRKEVCERVLREMDGNRPDLLERVQEVSVEHMLEVIVGEYVRRTRDRIRNGVMSGQSNMGADGPPPYEAVSKIRLTIPLGNGEYEDKLALLCSRTEIAAARSYYSRQRRAIDKREKYCADLERAMKDAHLSPEQTVASLYAA